MGNEIVEGQSDACLFSVGGFQIGLGQLQCMMDSLKYRGRDQDPCSDAWKLWSEVIERRMIQIKNSGYVVGCPS